MFLFKHRRRRNYDINNNSDDRKKNCCLNNMSKLVKYMKNISFERRLFIFVFSLLILCIIAIIVILLTHVNKLNLIKAKLNNYLAFFSHNNHNLSDRDYVQVNLVDTNQTDFYLNNQTLSLIVNFGNRSIFNSNNETLNGITNYDSSTRFIETTRKCGYRRSTRDVDYSIRRKKRIVNSKNAKENYGWIASIRFIYKNKKLSAHFCAGSLISTNYVITSANCIYQYKFDQSIFCLSFNLPNLF